MSSDPAAVELEIRALATRGSLARLTQVMHRAHAPLAARHPGAREPG